MMHKGKDFKIWGMSYGLIGDLIMGLPLLTYFEKKYPNSYKYWVIEKKCAMCAPIYLNHTLIDKIRITEDWGGLGDEDKKIRNECNIKTNYENWKHDSKDWYNTTSCVEETAKIAGIRDIMSVLDKEEMKPKLQRWFNVGFDNPECHTYTKNHLSKNQDVFDNNIAIYPFATAGDKTGRSPSLEWWNNIINILIDLGYSIFHYGRPTEPKISDKEGYFSYVHLSYFEQLKLALASKMAMGTDSGSMWVIGAYSHPSLHLVTNWLPDHNSNPLALAPINDNATNLFVKGGCDNIRSIDVVDVVKRIIKI
jgi:ADP-heptose:LPS heptosyltransferase